jgi:serine/threonine protein kinase
MSPELIYGKPVDRAVDLFAIAVMSYEMIAGKRPWDGAAPQEVMVAVAKTPLPPIGSTHASMSRRLEPLNRFFQRALSKKKSDRPTDAATFFRELSEAMYGTPRALVVPTLSDSTAEMSAIHMRLPNRVRSDETQIDMQPPRIDNAAEKTVEFHAVTREEKEVESASIRSVRLSSVWIQSIASSPSLEEPIDTMLDEQLPVDTSRMDQPSSMSLNLNDTSPMGAHHETPRSPWMWLAIGGGLALMMCVAAVVGFLIGRG